MDNKVRRIILKYRRETEIKNQAILELRNKMKEMKSATEGIRQIWLNRFVKWLFWLFGNKLEKKFKEESLEDFWVFSVELTFKDYGLPWLKKRWEKILRKLWLETNCILGTVCQGGGGSGLSSCKSTAARQKLRTASRLVRCCAGKKAWLTPEAT